MSFVKRITACMLLLASVFIVYPGSAKGFSYDEILAWVANELEIEGDYPLPEIFITSKNNLQEILIGKTKKSHMLWAKVYGEVEARKMMNKCLDEILGLFDPETKVIYVGDFMDSCKTQSIIAHELTHYLQVSEPKEFYHLPYDGENFIKMYNEMEASFIEERFM